MKASRENGARESPQAAGNGAALAVIFFLGLLLRGAALAAQFNSLEADPDGYRRLAIDWRQTGTFGFRSDSGDATAVRPTAYRPPLYPLLLAACVRGDELPNLAVAALHGVLGAATAAIVFLLARRAGLGRWSFLAATLTALDPILLNQSALVMTETLATLLAASGLLALSRYRQSFSLLGAAWAGAILGLAILCRPTFLIWLALVAAWICTSGEIPRRWRHALVLLVSAAVVLAPWTVRNYLQFGRPIFSTTHGGYTLWLGNNDLYYDHLHSRDEVFDAERLLPWLNTLRFGHEGDEVAVDRLLSQDAVSTIERRPQDFAWASLLRIRDLWRLTPRATHESESTVRTLARMAVGGWYAVVFFFAVVGLWAVRRQWLDGPWMGGILLWLAFSAVHTVYWSDMRMRAPLVPCVSLAAAAGAAAFASRRNRDGKRS